MATMSGLHTIEITYTSGRVEQRECPCEWCDVWRAVEPDLAAVLAAAEPEVRPDWLGGPAQQPIMP